MASVRGSVRRFEAAAARHPPDVGIGRCVAQDAAIDPDDLAGDEARLVTPEEDDGVRDVVRLSDARRQMVFLEHRDVLLAAEVVHGVGQDKPGAIALQRMPCFPYWVATYSVNVFTPPFEMP